MKLSKKAQIRMTETVSVLFIFFILVAFGMLFYGKYQEGAVLEKEEELFVKKAQDITTKLIYLPEIACTRGDSEAEAFCFDLMKLRSAGQVLEDDYYFDIFSFARITINQTYPKKEEDIIIYERLPNEIKKITPSRFIVALKDQSEGINGVSSYHFGFVKVEVFS